MDELLEALREFRDARDWAKFHTPKDLAVSVSVEAGELLELFQWRFDGHNPAGMDVARVADEVSDVVIYALLLFEKFGLDPKAEIMKKIAANERRFPVEETFGLAHRAR